MPAPRWDSITIVLVPLQFDGFCFVYDGNAAALDAVIHRRAGVAVEARLLSRLEQLQVASHRQESVAAVDGVFVFDVQPVIWVLESLIAELFQRIQGFLPLVMIGHTGSAVVTDFRLARRPEQAARRTMAARQGLLFALGPFLAKNMRVEIIDQAGVQGVDPNNRLIGGVHM